MGDDLGEVLEEVGFGGRDGAGRGGGGDAVVDAVEAVVTLNNIGGRGGGLGGKRSAGGDEFGDGEEGGGC